MTVSGGTHPHMSHPGNLAARIRADFTSSGLQVEGVSHDGDSIRIKTRLPIEFDTTDFCAAMFDQGATVMYKNDPNEGPTLIVAADTTSTDDAAFQAEASDDEAAPTTDRPAGPDKPSPSGPPTCMSRALRVLRAARLLAEALIVVMIAVYVTGLDDALLNNDTSA